MATTSGSISRKGEEEASIAAAAITAAADACSSAVHASYEPSVLQPDEWAAKHGEPSFPVSINTIKSIPCAFACTCSYTCTSAIKSLSATISTRRLYPFPHTKSTKEQPPPCFCSDSAVHIHFPICLRSPSTADSISAIAATTDHADTAPASFTLSASQPCSAATSSHANEPAISKPSTQPRPTHATPAQSWYCLRRSQFRSCGHFRNVFVQ